MSRRTRLAVAGLGLLAIVAAATLVVFALNACPVDTTAQPCPNAGVNRVVVIGLAALSVATLVAPFAFLAEFVLRRRIVFRGAWARATRRGLLAGGVVAVLAALRLGGALSTAGAIFVLVLAAGAEWFAIRRFDAP